MHAAPRAMFPALPQEAWIDGSAPAPPGARRGAAAALARDSLLAPPRLEGAHQVGAAPAARRARRALTARGRALPQRGFDTAAHGMRAVFADYAVLGGAAAAPRPASRSQHLRPHSRSRSLQLPRAKAGGAKAGTSPLPPPAARTRGFAHPTRPGAAGEPLHLAARGHSPSLRWAPRPLPLRASPTRRAQRASPELLRASGRGADARARRQARAPGGRGGLARRAAHLAAGGGARRQLSALLVPRRARLSAKSQRRRAARRAAAPSHRVGGGRPAPCGAPRHKPRQLRAGAAGGREGARP
jgi:hypothetical protein